MSAWDKKGRIMSIHQTYAVFGLGRYGLAVAKELVSTGAEVLAVDSSEAIVSAAAEYLPICKCADVTDKDTIEQLGISNIDIVIIAIAGDLEVSVMATALCKEAGVKTVIAKCASDLHRKILLRVGADKVVFPENESGIRLAKNLLSSGFVDVIDLSGNVSMIEMDVKPEWAGKTLRQLDLRRKHSVNVVAIRQNESVQTSVDPELALDSTMKLIIIADTTKLKKIL